MALVENVQVPATAISGLQSFGVEIAPDVFVPLQQTAARVVRVSEFSDLAVDDDYTAVFKKLNDNTAYNIIVVDVEYMSSDVEFRPAPNTTVIGLGGTLHITAADNKQSGIRANNGLRVMGRLTIDLEDVGAAKADWRRAFVSVGAYSADLMTLTPQSVTDVHISGLTFTGGHYDINGVFVTSASQRCTFTDIYIPDNALIGRAFLAHWGSKKGTTITRNATTGAITWDGTALGHPNSIKCERWVIDELTAGYDTALRADKATAFHISAGYNIEINQVIIKQCNNVVRVVGADWGFNYAVDADIVANKCHNIKLSNITCTRAAYRGLEFDALTTRDSSGNPYTTELVYCRSVVENVRISGIRTLASGSHLVVLNSAESVTFINTQLLNGASTGLFLNGPCNGIRGDLRISNVNSNALRITATIAANASDIRLTIKSTTENAAASTDPTAGAGVYLAACNNVVLDGAIGNMTAASGYWNGVYIESSCSDIDIGLRIGPISSGSTGKGVFANSSAYGQRLCIDRATVLTRGSVSGAFISRGPNNTLVIHSSNYPTTGTWSPGDIVFNNNPLTGQPTGWSYTSAGSWRPWAAFQ